MKKTNPFIVLFVFIAIMFLPSTFFEIKIILGLLCAILGALNTHHLYKSGKITKGKIYIILLLVGIPIIVSMVSLLYF